VVRLTADHLYGCRSLGYFGQPNAFSLPHGYLLINGWQLLSVAFWEKKNSNRREASDATQVLLTNWVCGRVWCCIWVLRSGYGGSWVRPCDDRRPAAPGTSVPARETASSVASIHTNNFHTTHIHTTCSSRISDNNSDSTEGICRQAD